MPNCSGIPSVRGRAHQMWEHQRVRFCQLFTVVPGPMSRRHPHGGHHTGLKAFSASAATLTYGGGAESSVMSQHLQLGLRACSAPSRGMDHTQHQQVPLLNLDVTTCGSQIWSCLRSLAISTHELLQQSPELKPGSSPPLPHFHSLSLIRHPPTEAAPGGRRRYPGGELPVRRCKPVWFALFVHRFTNQSSSSLPSKFT